MHNIFLCIYIYLSIYLSIYQSCRTCTKKQNVEGNQTICGNMYGYIIIEGAAERLSAHAVTRSHSHRPDEA